MRHFVYAATAALALVSLPALAATTDTTTNSNNSNSANSENYAEPWAPPAKHVAGLRHVASQIRSDLEQSGFTDIHIMPESFLVRAKNKQGMEVMMVVNPDSITAVTAYNASGDNSSNTASNSATSGENNDQAGQNAVKPGNGQTAQNGQASVAGSAKMQGTSEPNQVPASGAKSASNGSANETSKTQ